MSNDKNYLLSTFNNGRLSLKNRTVMAPMTRSRATQDHLITDIMSTYYGQRSGVGLIITEGVAPSPNGVGYARIPGIYNEEQTEGWKSVSKAVHKNDGKIFMQLMHTGRVSHSLNMPDHATILAPSEIGLTESEMYTDQEEPQAYPTPKAMTEDEIESTIQEYVDASKNAIEAGFDGVELHGANGYLIEQFINPVSNVRDDNYGGSHENRSRFAIEVANRVVDAIGADKVGIRLSPAGAFNEVMPFDGQLETYTYLAKELNKIGLVYIHLVDHSSMGAPEVPEQLTDSIKDNFEGILILSGGYDFEKADTDLSNKKGDLIAFGRPMLANPDLIERFRQGAELNEPDYDTFYTPGEKGYTDYPTLDE